MASQPTPRHRAALDYVERGLAVIPLDPHAKTPATKHGLNDWTDNPEQVDVWWGMGHDFNVGIVCGQPSGGLLVIDLDAHGSADGRETLREWETAHGKLPETVTAITGSGGKHLLYRTGHTMGPSANPSIGVDIRCDGSYIVAPPSIHPSGDAYEWSVSPEDMDVADASENVLAFVEFARPARADKFGDHRQRYELPEIITEGGRNDTLFRYAAQLRSRELDQGEILSLLEQANAARCKPPLPESDLLQITGSVGRYQPGHSAEVMAMERAKRPRAALNTDEPELQKPDPKAGIQAMVETMRMDAALTTALRWDVHEGRRWKISPLPLYDSGLTGPFTDADESAIWAYCQEQYGWTKFQNFEHALNILFACPELRQDRLHDLMDDMPEVRDAEGGGRCISWDGGESWEWLDEPRAGYLLMKWLGAEADVYTMQAELLLLRQIVARAMHPGCKADVMPVLYGPQGIGKSTFARALAIEPGFFLPSFSKFDEEHLRRLPGRLVVEVGELAAFKWRDMDAIKNVLSTEKDVIRMPYARNPVELKRSCVFIGTTNSHAFLRDTTGNRRFLPIECHATECAKGMHDEAGLIRDVRIAYGEVLAEYRADPETFLRSLTLPKDVAGDALAKQAEFSEADKLADDLADWLTQFEPGERLNVKRFFIEYYNLSRADWQHVPRNETKDALAAMDASPVLKRLAGKQLVRGFGTATAWEVVE